jgi:hypothetical protein
MSADRAATAGRSTLAVVAIHCSLSTDAANLASEVDKCRGGQANTGNSKSLAILRLNKLCEVRNREALVADFTKFVKFC